jgi:hypothetical protein
VRHIDEVWSDPGHAAIDTGRLPQSALIVTAALDKSVRTYLHEGGSVLLLQHNDGPLPVQRVPFWREAIKLLCPHPLWQRFPNDGFVDLQFFGLATDTAFDTDRIAALPDIHDYRPILRRLDARTFAIGDYLFEASVGKGRLVACSLRLHGSAGMQPTGLKRNVAGRFLLDTLLDLARSG